jgi:hypothetical protein
MFDPSVTGTGTFNVTYTYVDGAGCSTTVLQHVIVADSATFPSPSAICSNSPSVALTMATPAGGTYSGTGVVGSAFDPAVSGTGTFSINYSVSGCPAVTQDFIVNPAPSVTFSSLADACQNVSPFLLTGGTPTGGIYSSSTATVSSNMIYPALNPSGNYIINYTYTDSLGCSNNASQTIHINTPPPVNLNFSTVYCSGFPDVTLTEGTPAGGTYSGPYISGTDQLQLSIAPMGNYSITYSYTDGNGCSATATDILNIAICEGVQEFDQFSDVNVYPNPFADEVTFEFGNTIKLNNAELRVYDVVGKELTNINDINMNTFKFSKGKLAGGMYFYKVFNGGEKIAEGKLMIK